MTIALPVFRALADPTRLRILLLVRRLELAVGELAAVLGQSQPRVSRHLRILADAGVLRRFKEGAWVFVRLGDAALTGPVLAALDAWDPAGAAAAVDLHKLQAVRAERAAAASAYFAARAGEWDGLRSAHVAECEVEAAIVAALDGRPLGELLDIGTGTGRIIELLGSRARTVTGIDSSPEMLRLARGKLEAAGLGHAEIRLADMYALPRPDGSADTVVLHQVLHFAEDPAAAIREAARVLAPGGRLLIADFAPHDREELRRVHAHARLGFDEAQVRGWLEGAGLAARVAGRLAAPAGVEQPLTVTLWTGDRAPAARRAAA